VGGAESVALELATTPPAESTTTVFASLPLFSEVWSAAAFTPSTLPG